MGSCNILYTLIQQNTWIDKDDKVQSSLSSVIFMNDLERRINTLMTFTDAD